MEEDSNSEEYEFEDIDSVDYDTFKCKVVECKELRTEGRGDGLCKLHRGRINQQRKRDALKIEREDQKKFSWRKN